MTREKVSIILPTYNRADLVQRAIKSVLQQSYKDFELIVVDDGSTDDTQQVVENINDERIRYKKLSENSGPSNARNTGIDMAKYDYIAFHDSDDCWRAEKLQKQMDKLAKSPVETGFVYGCYEYNSLDGRKAWFPRRELERERKCGYIYPYMLVENLIGMPTILVKKECIEKIGKFNAYYPSLEDYEWMLRLSSVYQAAYIDEVLVDVYATKGSVNQNLSANFSARCMLIGQYKEEMARYGVLEQVIQEFLAEADYLGCKEAVLNGLLQVLER